ncbi:MAG: RNA polymerase sigma factor, partial [Isosphaeraceae bacterium]
MASMRRDGALRQIDRLFGEGTLAGLSDARLLERYVAARDESAFEALVVRHGPMVLSVCRRVLIDPNDADDAFQAAFLLLARKARSIWVEGSIGGWLHRVAWRIAVQLREDAARRRDQERRAVEHAGEPLDREDGHDDTAAVIHQEIERLPEHYRRPVVLCYLEDMTYQQAADHLQWSEATTRGRLSRARDLLRSRLTRRGITLAGMGLMGAGERSLGAVAPVPEP